MEDRGNAVRAQLGRILTSPQFVRSERLTTLLRYLVERALDGKSDDLKETVIGVEAFGRDPGYNPKTDPIVRIQAARLREKLRDYYDDAAHRAELIIQVPKGTYIPRWQAAALSTPHTWRPLWIAVGVTAVCLALAVWLWWHSRRPVNSIAVLPLKVLTAGADNESVAAGLAAEIIHDLNGLPGVAVVSETSSFALGGKQKPVREIGSLLGVDAAMEGDLQSDGDRIKVLARVVRTADDRLLWSGAFERDRQELFDLEGELASAIVRTLRPNLGNWKSRSRPMDPAAYQLYLRGLHVRSRWTAPAIRGALALFIQAAEKDPRADRAWAAQAYSYYLLSGLPEFPQDVLVKARTAAQRALEIDANSADAYTALGYVRWFLDRDRAGAEQAFTRALQLKPSSPEALQAYCHYLMDRGQLRRGLEIALRVEKLDPLSPEAGRSVAVMYLQNRRPDEAIAQCRKVLELDPEYRRAYNTLGRAYLLKGMCSEAMNAFQRMPYWDPQRQTPLVGYAYARCGHKDEARRILAHWEQELAQPGRVEWQFLALIWAGLGDKQKALDWLDKSRQQRSFSRSLVGPEWDVLRGEPRFEALRNEMGIEFPGDGTRP
jgi:serine/threonine-protein kinase